MTTPQLTRPQRYFVLTCALLAWMCSGLLLAMPPLAARQAVASMGVTDEAMRGVWFSRYVCAFLLGAATGGLVFGFLGDRLGRSKALGLSVLTYSLLAGACYFVRTPEQLLVLWFLACTGVGGVWPNGVSLASEAFPGMSRPWLAGLFGTVANLGLILLSELSGLRKITPDDWRWVMLVCASPVVLGGLIVLFLPESPMWLVRRLQPQHPDAPPVLPSSEVFRPPILKYTILGILLATVPMMGNWGATNWMVPWASKVQELVKEGTVVTAAGGTLTIRDQSAKQHAYALGDAVGITVDGKPGSLEELRRETPIRLILGRDGKVLSISTIDGDDERFGRLSSSTQTAKSSGAAIGALLGGWVASLLGRRTSYFLITVISLSSSFYIFHSLTPLDEWFLLWVFVQGFFGTVYFGWMPLYFPELFPTRMRATGTGVAFNFGRIATAVGVFLGGWVLLIFQGDYAKVGQVTCLVYAVGLVVICFAPDTSQKRLDD